MEAVKAKVARSAGLEVALKTLKQRALLELRDLGDRTTREGVENSVFARSGSGRDHVKVVSLRRQYSGTQLAVITIEISSSLVNDGRLLPYRGKLQGATM